MPSDHTDVNLPGYDPRQLPFPGGAKAPGKELVAWFGFNMIKHLKKMSRILLFINNY